MGTIYWCECLKVNLCYLSTQLEKMDPSTTLRWGICGAGKISADFATCMKNVPVNEQKITAVAARDVKRAESFAGVHGIETSYSSYEEIAKDDNIDVVYIGCIHTEHFRLSMLMLEHNKHVLCEKPLCLNAKQTKKLLSYAKSKNLFMMEAVWSRFFPAYAKVKELISSGVIGSVNFVHSRFGTAYTTMPPRIAEKELAGGGLLDVGIYTVQFSQMVFDNEVPKKQLTQGSLLQTGVDADCNILLEYSNNRSSSLSCSITTALGTPGSIHGTLGYITVGPLFWCPTEVKVFNRRNEVMESHEFPLPPTPNGGSYNFRNSQGLTYEILHVRECLIRGAIESDLLSSDDSIAISEILTKARNDIGYYLDVDDKP